MHNPTHRRQALARTVAADGLDALLVTHPANVTYLTGFTGDSSYVVAGAAFVLVSDARFEQQIAEECPGLEVHIRPHDQRLPAAAAAVLTKAGARNVGLEADHATLGLLAALQAAGPKLTFAPVDGRVERLRMVKDPGEVEQLRAAVRAAERAFGMFRAMLRETDTEKEMADALDAFLRRAGAAGSAFPPIVAVGDRGALPHAPPTDRPLSAGSKLLVDWGADLGYKSDLTRTFLSPFGVAPSPRNKAERRAFHYEEIAAAVAAAHDAAVAELRDGASGKAPDAAARKSLAGVRLKDGGRVNLADHFTHGLGHGIGLEVHEAPQLRANSADTLEAGMVVTVEPGVYLPGWGGVRLEDDYLITRDEPIRLSTLPLEFVV